MDRVVVRHATQVWIESHPSSQRYAHWLLCEGGEFDGWTAHFFPTGMSQRLSLFAHYRQICWSRSWSTGCSSTIGIVMQTATISPRENGRTTECHFIIGRESAGGLTRSGRWCICVSTVLRMPSICGHRISRRGCTTIAWIKQSVFVNFSRCGQWMKFDWQWWLLGHRVLGKCLQCYIPVIRICSRGLKISNNRIRRVLWIFETIYQLRERHTRFRLVCKWKTH